MPRVVTKSGVQVSGTTEQATPSTPALTTGRPPARITITVNGEQTELFASFGLIRELAAISGGLENIQFAVTDPQMMVEFMATVLSKRNAEGQIETVFNAAYCEIEPDDVDQLMDWIYGHVYDFFVRRVRSLEKVMTNLGPELARLNSSATGLANSISNPQPAGASA